MSENQRKSVEYNRKKVFKTIIQFIGIVVSFVVLLIGYGVYWAFYDMNRLPTGEFLTEETSPDGKYTLRAYMTDGGATAGYSVRGELVYNEKSGKAKNIYWNYREEKAKIIWKDNDTVNINGHELTVRTDKFDFRHQ